MTDPSEQCVVYNNDLDPEESVAEHFDENSAMRQVDEGEHVLGILDIREIPDQATLIIQPNGLELDGQHIYIEKNEENGEYIVVVQENRPDGMDEIEESEVVIGEACEEKQELRNDEDSIAEFEISPNSEQLHIVSYESPDNTQNKDDYEPTSSSLSNMDSQAEGHVHEKLLHLAVVAQEMQSADANYSKLESIQEFQCSRIIPEESVIVSQMHADTDSALYRSSETEVSSSTDLASEQDSHSGIGEVVTDCNVQAETPAIKRKTSFSCISSTRTLDNTVSVIHTTSSIYPSDNLEKGVEGAYISNDFNTRPESDVSIAKSDKSEDSEPALCVNLSQDSCSNPNNNLLNQDEDSVLSQNSELDLTKESNLNAPVCDEDSIPAMEQSRSRYGIMDSLNKDKRTPYYDTNTSEDIEDTINSSSRSTNITEDIESTSENSNQMECNNEELGVENNVSSEALCAENGKSVECVSTIIEACGSSNPEISQDSKTENKKEQIDQSKRKLRSFKLSLKDDSNSKSSAVSDNIPSPLLHTKDLNSVQKRGRPKQKTKKALDAYEFDDGSAEKEQPILSESEASEVLEQGTIESKGEKESVLKLTFHEALSSVLDKEDNKKTCDDSINSDQSADLFDGELEVDENIDSRDNQEEITSNHESVISKQEKIESRSEDAFLESPNTKNEVNEPCPNVGNAVPNVLDTEENLQSPSQTTLLEEKKADNDLVKPPQKTYIRKRKAENDLVQPPQKTYITKKKVPNVQKDGIELFSCDDFSTKDNKNPLNVDSQKNAESTSGDQVKEFGMDDDGMESNVQSKVSTTYKRKRKSVPPIVRANRTRSLRKRSSKANETEENEEEENTSLRELEERLISEPSGKVNEEDNWAHILLGTKFNSEPGSADPPMTSSTIPNSSSPPRNRKRPVWFTTPNSNKSQLTSGKQFDKLIKSSPSKVKCHTSNEKKKLRDKIKKQAMSLCNTFLPSSPCTEQKRGRPKTKISKEPHQEAPSESNGANLKKSVIKYLCAMPVGSNPVAGSLSSSVSDPNLFQCNNKCGFVCSKINNLIYHSKVCSSEFDSNDLEDSSKLFCDMDKRQRIRGETKNKEKEWNGSSMDLQESQPSCSKTYQRKFSEKEKNDRVDDVKKYGFAKMDIVWFKRGRMYWPALAWDIQDKEALFYIITSPDHCEPESVRVQLLKKYVHSFDDVELSKRILDGKKANKDVNYIKAVQKANSYNQKRFLFEPVDAKKFFDIEDYSVTKINGSSESEMMFESPIIQNENEEVDVSKVLKCIARGECDKHVVSIFRQEAPSQRHGMFFNEEPEVVQQLEDMSWFGPFKTDASMQLELYDHFYELYKRKIEGAPNVSYIYKVWIPEGIIKAISLVNRISLTEAELIFLRHEPDSRMPSDPLDGASLDSSLIETPPNSSPRETSQMSEAELNSSLMETSQILEASLDSSPMDI